MKLKILVFVFLSILTKLIFADVSSTSGNLHFDPDNSGVKRMTLTTNGLGIGIDVPSANLHLLGNAIVSEKLAIGTTSAISTLTLNGSMGFSLENVSTNVTLNANSMVLVNSGQGNIRLTLPEAKDANGRYYMIKKISSDNNLLFISGNNLIDNYTSLQTGYATTYPSFEFMSQGNQWYLLSRLDSDITTISTDNLIGWWKLDETNGVIANDSSPSGQNGTLNGGLTFSGCSITGQSGNALYFDGSNDYIGLADDFYDMGTNKSFTLTAWVKVTSASSYSIFHKGATGTGAPGYWFRLSASFAYIGINDTSGSPSSFLGTASVFDDNWHFVAASISRTSNTFMYVNGQYIGQADLTSEGNIDFGGILSIGARHTGGLAFKGGIDDARIYNKAMSQVEIQAIYNSMK